MALAMVAQAAPPDNDGNNNGPRRNRGGNATKQAVQPQGVTRNVNRRSVNTSSQVRASGNVNATRHRNFSAQGNANTTVRSNRIRTSGDTNVTARANTERFRNRDVNARRANRLRNESNLSVNRERNLNRNVEVNRNRNVTVNRDVNRNINRNVTRNVNRNVSVTNNWRSDRFRGSNYTAFRNYHREWHDRGWWNNHYNRISFFFGAPYYWNSGYWYPAWGYSPGVSFTFDGPIYGYNNLAPDQVVVNVQAQLQADGYYDGPVDGQLGPMTRQAIADFQADRGLAVTAAVDEPTLESLGLV